MESVLFGAQSDESSRHSGSLTAANWVSFDFNVAYSSRWGYSLINTLKLKKYRTASKLDIKENVLYIEWSLDERGVAGSDPSTRGRSPVVLEVRFRSRAFSIVEIQSEIVLGYLHYLDFCTV